MKSKNRFWFLGLAVAASVGAAPGKPMCDVTIRVEGRVVGADTAWLILEDRSERSRLWEANLNGAAIETKIALPAGRDYRVWGEFPVIGGVRGLLVAVSTSQNTEYYAPEKDFDGSRMRRSQMLGVSSWFTLTSVCEVD